MADSRKRKDGPPGNGQSRGGGSKRRQGGTGKKWQTPYQSSKRQRGGTIEPDDLGIWATCMKDKEGKATEELKVLFDEYAARIYGIAPTGKEVDGQLDESATSDPEEDIEASIEAELSSLTNRQAFTDPSDPAAPTSKVTKLFTPIFLEVQCVLFFKTAPPIVPIDFVKKICVDAKNGEKSTCRFVNRLTPMEGMGRASERGLVDVTRTVLLQNGFKLQEPPADDERSTEEKTAIASTGGSDENSAHWSYAIRPTIRNHSTLTRDTAIKLVANQISTSHKVNLSKPDKIILVEIYQNICGIAVVDPDWDAELKRYNIFELSSAASSEEMKSKPADPTRTKPLLKQQDQIEKGVGRMEKVVEQHIKHGEIEFTAKE